jgi:glutamyl-tRNA reductase
LVTVFLEILWGYGGDWIDPETREVSIDQPEALRALDFLKRSLGTISPTAVTTYAEEDTRTLFQNGRAVFLRNWPYVWTAMAQSPLRKEGRVGMAPVVHAPGQRSAATLGGWGFAISKLTRNPEAARLRLRACFRFDLAAGEAGPSAAELESHLYEHGGPDAMRHVLRVASSLDSMVVGEPQILGQTKDAYRAAVECGAAGPILGRLFQHAFATAKRVRSETRVAARPVSVARVAVDLAEQIFEELAGKRALLLGAGEMTEAALAALRERGLASVTIANRTPERAEPLAARFGARVFGLAELPRLLAEADVVLSSIAGDVPLLTPGLVSAALAGRKSRPLFVIDIGVPRNADPALDQLDDVYLYDLDDLCAIADLNAAERSRDVAKAEAIIEEQQQRFDGWFAALRAVPTIRHLRERVESLRADELERALAKLQLSDAQRAGVELLTRSLVNKILHAPVSRLRREAEREEGIVYLETARVLFGLDEGGVEPDDASCAPVSDPADPTDET